MESWVFIPIVVFATIVFMSTIAPRSMRRNSSFWIALMIAPAILFWIMNSGGGEVLFGVVPTTADQPAEQPTTPTSQVVQDVVPDYNGSDSATMNYTSSVFDTDDLLDLGGLLE